MATFEIVFDVNIDCHEYIEAEDEWEAEELAQRMLEDDGFYNHVFKHLKYELNNKPYIEARCIGESTSSATITKDGLAVMEAGNGQDAV